MQKNKIKVFHITPHLGGGVGKVLLNYLSAVREDSDYIHSIATLDYANDNSIKASKEIGFELFSDMHKNTLQMIDFIKEADIVLVHFWNHPLLYDFLVRNELPASRVIFWSHISGFNAPNIFTPKLLNYPDKFIFTTPLSFNTKEVREFEGKDKLSSIWSTGGVEYVKDTKAKPHKGFNIGYIGTVDYSKMHRDFLEICSKINIPDVKFIICGGAKHLELKKQAEAMGIAEKFEFTGQIDDIKEYLEIFDVFGYPLNPEHYGTCDQVLQEAMAAGIVPVVLNNPMENLMLKNGEIGVVSNNIEDYILSIENFYDNPQLKIDLAKKAKEHAIREYSLNKLTSDWNKSFAEVLQLQKTSKKWAECISHLSYLDIFKESIGEYKSLFMIQSEKDIQRIEKLGNLHNWSSKTKGTIHQYYNFFSDCDELKQISKIMSSEGIKIG